MKTTISIFLTAIFYKHVSCYLRVCYYTNWSQYRPNGGKFTPDDIDPNLCSHIIYAFGKLEGNVLVPFEWNDDSTDWSMGMYEKVNNLKTANPKLRTLLAVGGWNAGSLPFSDMVATRAFRRQFINSTLHYLRKRNFDGLDMDWEYPARRGGRPEDKANLVLLLGEMKQAFEQESYHTGRPRLLLTAAVPAGKSNIDAGYDIPNVARSLDFINIMSYDLHGSWEQKTGHNSPLFGRASESADDAILNMKWAIKYWAQRGAPKHKLIVGIGLYGRSFKLQSPTINGIGAPSVGAGVAGRYTREPGFMSYYEVCEELQKGATRVWQAEHRAPYLHKDDLWVGYDDEESVVAKVQWMKRNKYGGIMVWSLALDDFSGQFCNKGRYPLLTAINRELGAMPDSGTGPIQDSTAKSNAKQKGSQRKTTPVHETHSFPQTGITLTLPEFSATNSMNSLSPEIHSTAFNAAVPSTPPPPPPPPPSPPIFQSNSGTNAAVQAIGDLLLHGTTKLSAPKAAGSNIHEMNHNELFTNLETVHSHSPLHTEQTVNMQNPINEFQTQDIPLLLNNEQFPSITSTQTENSSNLPSIIAHDTVPLEFVHGHGHATSEALHSLGSAIQEPPLTNTLTHISPDPVLSSVSQQASGPSITPVGFDVAPTVGIDPAIVLPDTAITINSETPTVISPQTGSRSPEGIVALGEQTSPVVIGNLPVVHQAAPGVITEPVLPARVIESLPTVDRPVAAAAHSDIGLASVRPAPRSRPSLNFSFSSSSSSNSSSSSSSSSSNSTQQSSFNIEPGTGTSRSSLSTTIQDLLRQGPVDILPLPIDGNVLSVVDQNQGIVPGGTVEAVIPIDNIDSLTQVLANLQTSIPTAGTVLMPEPRNNLRPETVLRELDIANILGSNIVSPVPVERVPPQQTDSRAISPAVGNINNQVQSQVFPQTAIDNRLPRTQFVPQINNHQTGFRSIAQMPQTSRRVFPVTYTQLRRLISTLGRETVRGLLQSGRIVFQQSVPRRQIIRRPVIRTRAPSLRNTVFRQDIPTRISPSTRNILTSRFQRPQRRIRNFSFENNSLNRTPAQSTRTPAESSSSRRVNSNRDILSMLGL